MIIRIFKPSDQEEIIRLALHCQNDGTRPVAMKLEDQTDLLAIQEEYLNAGGCFWVAEEHQKIAGSIGLMNAGNGIGILKKFFVYEAYRGNPHHLGQKLYCKFLDFAKAHEFHTIVLDTPKNTERAHQFYEKAGFRKIRREEMPVQYHYPYDDSDFFRIDLERF